MVTGSLCHPSRVLRVLQTTREPLTTKEIADRLINFYPRQWKEFQKGKHVFDAIEGLRSNIGTVIRTKKLGDSVVTIEEKRPRRHYIPD